MNNLKNKIKSIKDKAVPTIASMGSLVISLKDISSKTFSEQTSTLSQDVFLKWLEGVTQGAASIYDKALDAQYLKTHVGGGTHRLFDGGHDLFGAWKAAQDANPNDGFVQEVSGYASALWKDFTTVKGLPFQTYLASHCHDINHTETP